MTPLRSYVIAARRIPTVLSRHRRKLAATLALAATLGVAAVGTTSLFTSAGTRTQDVSSGSFAFILSDPSTGAFTTAISGMAPGDFADREVTMTNPAGGLNYAQVALTATAATTSLLDSDAVNVPRPAPEPIRL
jgi:hypothetical protein